MAGIFVAKEVFFDEPDLPPPPDYVGAAEATAEANAEAAQLALEQNRFDINTPTGTLTWDRPEEDSNIWTQNINLSPEQQLLYDKNMQTQQQMADIGLMGLDQMSSVFDTPFEIDDFEGYREDVYDAMLDRLETDINRDWESTNANLYAAGIGRDTEAYARQKESSSRALNDARLQAYISATDQALREQDQQVKNDLLMRNQPINELNAFRTGSQVSMPTFDPQAPAQTVAGTDYLGAADMQSQYDLAGYNADVSRQNAIMGGLFSLGGAAIMA